MANMRRASLFLTIDGANVSADLAPYVLGFTYTDNANGKADDLQLELEDRGGRFRGDWFPDKGSVIAAGIIVSDWDGPGRNAELPCGEFSIDEVTLSGPPSRVQIKGVSIPIRATIRWQRNTRSWENTTLQGIAGDIAGAGGIALFWESDNDPSYQRKEQADESDLKFLKRLCDEAGLSVKVTDKQLVIFDEEKYDGKPSSAKITLGTSPILSYSFGSKTAETFAAATVRYHDSSKKDDVEHTFTPASPPPTGATLEINRRVESPAEAETIAKKELRKRNRLEVTAQLSVLGNPALVSGVNITLAGFGKFDGKYAIESATHTVSNGGYTTSIDARKTLEGY